MKRGFRNLLIITGLVTILASMSIVSAQPRFDKWVNPAGREVYIPYMAIEVVPRFFSLGCSLTSDGRLVYFVDITPQGTFGITVIRGFIN